VELPKEQPKEPPKLELPTPPAVTPNPQIEAEDKPRSPFERPGGGPTVPVPPAQRQVPMPDVAAVIHGGVPGGMAGSSGATLPSTQAGPGGDLELPQLLTDVQGIDFRPYLTRLLFTVKRNWMLVWPESARSGRKGKVGVQFSIGRDGTVQKVVFAYQSGADALDRAAIAAISMSTPFGALPTQFKGDRVVLQFNFSYNIPKQ
jgi:TonB family protein